MVLACFFVCLTVSLSLPVCMSLSLCLSVSLAACLSVTKCLTIKRPHFCHYTQYKDSVILLCTSPDFSLCFLLLWCYLSELHLWFFSSVALLSRRSRHHRSPPSTRSISLRVRSGPASRCRYTRSLFLPAVQTCKMMICLCLTQHLEGSRTPWSWCGTIKCFFGGEIQVTAMLLHSKY